MDRKKTMLAVLLTGQFMVNIDVAIVNVAGPAIRDGLRSSGGELEFVISGYTLAYAALLITGARLGDTRGYRRMFLLGLAGFTLASLACGMAPGATALSSHGSSRAQRGRSWCHRCCQASRCTSRARSARARRDCSCSPSPAAP
ncbi:MFS transporter [Nonomuraea sp. NPDC049152]|uniref:MFS transporter n=1 Tax=Nonomuraea sp. NPDC049152 TaxID=3154350 RepID=UPI0033EBB2F1